MALFPVLLLLGRVGGHMVMNTPPSYNLDTAPLLQVDPLSGGQFPFPCQNRYSFTARTPVEAGSATLVNFTGGAQHGGGSCQFSITYDEPVDGGSWNKSARFQTIYSIIGGCPAVFTDEARNLPSTAMDKNMREDAVHCGNDHGIDCIRQFMIPVPKFLKNGPATFAWTWFNKLGNKEMYMNCAPINITGGTGDEQMMADLPDIFVANYPNDPEVPNCVTGNHGDKVVVNFPNPGRYGRVLENPMEPPTKPADYCTQIPAAQSLPIFEPDPQTNAPASSSTSSAVAATSSTDVASSVVEPTTLATTSTSATASSSSTTSGFSHTVESITSSTTPTIASSTTTTTTTNSTAPTIAPTTNIPIGCNATIPHNHTLTGAPRMTVPTTLKTTVTESHATNFTSRGARPSSSPSWPSAPTADAIPCPVDGQLVCLGDTRFGLCNWGWAVPQDVAAGTKCREGKIVMKRGGDDGKEGGVGDGKEGGTGEVRESGPEK